MPGSWYREKQKHLGLNALEKNKGFLVGFFAFFFFFQIRTTLEKIRNQIFKDEVRHNSTNHRLDAKVINSSKYTTFIPSVHKCVAHLDFI